MKSTSSRFKTGHCFYAFAILAKAIILVNVASCAWLPVKAEPHHVARAPDNDIEPGRLNPEDLQRELFQFVDRYSEMVEQVTDEGVYRAKSSDLRVWFLATKTVYVSAAISIVTGPRPIDALRDLLVMVTLQRMVWESGAGGQIPPTGAEPVARVLRLLEKDIYDLAKHVLPSDAITKLRALITKWRGDNPNQYYVAYVRFQNLGDSPVSDEVDEIISSGGFLEPVEEVAREAHEARLLAERTLFLANRMPMFIEWHTTLAYRRIAASPEVSGVLDNLHGYRDVLEAVGQQISELPGKIAEQRRSLVVEFAQLIGRERAETLRNMQMLIRSEREALFSDLSKGADTYGPILEQLAVTAAATRDAVSGIERMTASRDGRAGDGANFKQVHEIAERLATAAIATNEVVVGLNSLFNAELGGLASIDAILATQVQRVFLYAAALILLFGAVLYVVLRTFRRPAN